VRIEVTQADIDRGVCESYMACPIVHATRRALDVKHVWIDEDGITVIDANNVVSVMAVPQSAFDFIVRFDGGKHVEPFTFDLEVPA